MEKSIFSKLTSGKRKYFLIAAIIVIAAVIWVVRTSGKKSSAVLVSVDRGNVTEEVVETGTVKPQNDVNLAFEKSGTIAYVNKDVGDKVYAGETIVSLKNTSEQAALENARASLDSAKAKYEELSGGSRPEEISVKEAELAGVKQTLENYYANIPLDVNDAYNKCDNAVNQQTDALFSNDQTSQADFTFTVSDSQKKNDAVSARIAITGILAQFKNLDNTLLSTSPSKEELDAALSQTKNYLLEVQDFLIKVSAAVDAATGVSEANISTYKTNISTGRSNVNTALQTITDLIQNIASQKISVEKTSRELDLEKLGSTPEVLSQQQSAILIAEANVKSAEAALEKTIIRSPLNGVITKQNAKVGELAAANSTMVSVISAGHFNIESNVPEADLTKLKIGDKAEITLDAYGTDVLFEATVVSIDPAEIVIDGVSTYKVTFVFDQETKPVRSGMTANITVKTNEKNNVLMLPQRTVYTVDGKRFVKLVTPSGTTETEVQTGLKGSNGMIEITNGLEEGDRVENYTK